MRTIKVKIIAGILFCVLLSAVMIGMISIQNSTQIAKTDAEQLMQLICENQSAEINALISRIEQSVDTLSSIAQEDLDFQKFQTNAAYVDEYTKNLKAKVLDFAEHTEGAITAYVRYNPDFTDPTSGIFYSRSSLNTDFEELVPTDFSIYDKSDTTHVGWYYIPVENKAPIWMAPYLNENINTYMISYVMPIYIDGISMGIIGMDIDFSQVTDIVDSTVIYQSGYAFLASTEGKIMYHHTLSTNQSITEIEGQGMTEMVPFLADDKNIGKAMEYQFEGNIKKLMYQPLKNGMRFVLAAPLSEIHANADKLKEQIFYAVIGSVFFVGVIGAIIGFSIANPIKKLTKVIRQTAALDFTDHSNMRAVLRHHDEIGKMAKAVHEMRKTFREIVKRIDSVKENTLKNVEKLDSIMQMNQSLSENTSATTQELAAGMEETSGSAQTITSNIKEAKKNSEKIHELTQNGKTNSEIVMSRAAKLRGTTEKSNEKAFQTYEDIRKKTEVAMQQSKAVQKINELTEDIKKISSQTNMLALNASIEAARAGDAGRGFSVVAKEIGTLATQTLHTVEDIDEIITEVNNAVSNMSYCIETTMEFLEKTVITDYDTYREVADQYEKDAYGFKNAMDSINDAICVLNTNITGISGSIEEISTSINQSSDGITEIAERSSEVAGNVQIGYHNLSENKKYVNELKEIVEKFNL